MGRSLDAGTSKLIIGTVVASGSASLVLLGTHSYFGATSGCVHAPMAWLTVPMRGTTCHSTVSGIGDAQALGFGVNKLLATFFGAVAGALGSLFLPSLSLGAELGPSRHLLPPQLPLAQVVAPLMRAVFIGIPCSRLVHLEGIYHALSHRFVAQARR